MRESHKFACLNDPFYVPPPSSRRARPSDLLFSPNVVGLGEAWLHKNFDRERFISVHLRMGDNYIRFCVREQHTKGCVVPYVLPRALFRAFVRSFLCFFLCDEARVLSHRVAVS